MNLAEHQARLVADFIEENWSDFLQHVGNNYDSDEEAEQEAEDIVKELTGV